jgi:hypothetical protein
MARMFTVFLATSISYNTRNRLSDPNRSSQVVVLEHDSLPEISVCLRHRSGWLAALERIQQVI